MRLKVTTKFRKNTILFLLVLLSASGSILLSQGDKPSRLTAMAAFTKGDYELAFGQFSELLITYPRDPLYKYYSAVCLINLERDPAGAKQLLSQALDGTSVKSLPAEALFYLGRASQMIGNYTEAERAYRRYTEEAGRKKAKEMNVSDFIQQCKENTGKLSQAALKPIIAAEEKKITATQVKTREALPAKMDKELDKTLEMQYKADSVDKAAAERKKESVSTKLYSPPAGNTKPETPQVVKKEISQAPAIKDSDLKIKSIINEPEGVFSVFEVLPKPVTDPKVTILINPETPDGLVYRIQLAVFRNPVSFTYFKGISPIFGFKANGMSTYYAGMFRLSADAAKARTAVRSKGFRDAFVVAMMGNKTLSSERAAVLEKEWGNKPLFRADTKDKGIDTIPPTLTFRVEVTRSKQSLTKEAVYEMTRAAGDRGLDVQHLNDGNIVYLIGNYITFESADEYSDLLVRNGFRDAKVVAWLGKREIDVETAKQLFEKLR